MEIVGFESHDNGLSMESLASWFYIEKLLAVCRYVIRLQQKAIADCLNATFSLFVQNWRSSRIAHNSCLVEQGEREWFLLV